MSKEDKPDAWMPLYIGDWDGDTGHLTNEQDGAYGRLVRWYWRKGPLPDDDAMLASIVRTDLKAWRRLRAALSPFFAIADGRWNHKRVDEELERWGRRKLKAVERARKGGEALKAKREVGASSSASSTLQAVLKQCSSSSSSKVEPSRGSTLTASELDCAPSEGAPSPRLKPELVAGIDVDAEWRARREADKAEVRAMVAALKRGGRPK